MRHEVERPDVNDPFSYAVKMDESTLLLVMDAMNAKYGVVDYAIGQHAECNRLTDDGCKVYKHTYGVEGSCYNELNELHAQASAIISFLREARFVRENREVKSEASFRSLQDEARKVTETALRTLAPTGAYKVLDPEGSGERVPAPRVPSDLETHTGKVDLETVQRIRDGLTEQLNACKLPDCGCDGNAHA